MSKVYFKLLHGKPIKNKIIIWLRLGKDEGYVMNPEPPSNNRAHWRVIEELRERKLVDIRE
jgi:hypothetical protein